MDKLCINCKHMYKSPEGASLCAKANVSTNLVTGMPYTKFARCSTNRSSGWLIAFCDNECGVTGRYYEEKDE